MATGSTDYSQAGRLGRLFTDLGEDALLLTGAQCEEALSRPFAITVDAFSPTPQAVHDLLGTQASVEMGGPSGFQHRWFSGIVWEYTELGEQGYGHAYRLLIRPAAALMTLNRRNRVFQNKSVVDIVRAVVTAPIDVQLTGTYDPLEYCVQYQESDWDFVNRLLEYEGIYFFFAHAQGTDTMVLVDDRNTHAALAPATATVRPDAAYLDSPSAWNVTERRAIAPAKVTVDDYDFEAPTAQMAKFKTAPKPVGSPSSASLGGGQGSGGSWSAEAEIYEFPAKYISKETSVAQRRSAAWLDAHRNEMARTHAATNVGAAATGKTLTLAFDGGKEAEYLVAATVHRYSGPDYHSGGEADELYVMVELVPAADQYRPPLQTARPRIYGPQTALVTGPSGEEIHTDKYGRIKVQFPWDREGKKDENSSCFVRVVQSGAGQGWGSFALPRIGQEVVVEFLDGDPDRPLVTGAVYNASNTVPEALPANKTQFGMKSRITKGGGGFNRLWFEDKKDSEVVWFRAERDYKANIVNKDEERVYDKGHRTTTFKEGNDTLTLNKGNLTTTLDKGDEERTLTTGSRTTTIQKNEVLDVKAGNREATIAQGNDTLTVTMGDITVKVSAGNHKTQAAQSIELTCGGSKIKMDPTSISLEAMTVKIDAKLMMQIKGLMVQSEASAINTIKGGMVMIN